MNQEELESLFSTDSSKAIEESKKTIAIVSGYSTYEDFVNYHTDHAHFSYCPKPFSSDYRYELSIFCLDCTLNRDDLAFICLPCFMKGNHEGHSYFVFPGLVGHCACGDVFHTKSSCFCSSHQKCDDENLQNYLSENLREYLVIVFKSSFVALKKLKGGDIQKSFEIVQFVAELFNLGDGFRRLFVMAITEKLDFDDLIDKIPDYDDQLNSFLTTLFSFLLHDQLFMKRFSKAVIKLLSEKLIKDSTNCMVKKYSEICYDVWFPFFYHCFSEPICRYNIESNNWDWVSFSIDLLTHFKELLALVKNQKYKSFPSVFSIIKNVPFFTSIQPNEETQNFFDRIVTEVFCCGTQENEKSETNDTIIIASFKRRSFSSSFKPFYDYLQFFHLFLNSFESKPNLKFDKLIDELDKKIDITPIFMINKNYIGKENGKKNENDKLISRFINSNDKQNLSFFDKFKSTMKNIFQSYPSKFYKSIFNGGSFFLGYSLYDFFCFLFNVDDFCRIKLSRFISMEKYQPLRIKLGIITMKKLVSTVYFDLNITNILNSHLSEFYEKIYESRKQIRFNFMPINILQLLIGIQCSNKNKTDEFIIKEFFAFELAREFGLFDNINNEKSQDIVFGFFYIALLLVIDRSLFHDKNRYCVTEEQIIFALKRGIHSIDQLNEMCDRNDKPGDYFTIFNEILMKVATKNTNNLNEENDNEENISLSQLRNNRNNNNDNDDNEEGEEEDDDDDDENNEEVSANNENDETVKAHNNKKESQNSYIKPVNFYLKEGIECKSISSIIPICEQKSFMNVEVSKNQNKLLKIQDFEPEESYFFISNDNNNNNENDVLNSSDLKICLKQFLFTPTVLAVVYDSLRQSERFETQEISLNDHLAMNILILASKFIKEELSSEDQKTKFNEKENISYASLVDLISKIKHSFFNYRVEGKGDDEKGYIEVTMNPTNFASFLKIKFEPTNLPAKSLIDLLVEKGPIGEETLHQIMKNIQIEGISKEQEKENEEKENEIKTIQKEKAAKLKQDIMNQYSNIRNQYRFSDSISDSLLMSSIELFSPNNKVCSLCSESKKKEILSYPLYIYRTKLPFIFDKPPLFDNNVNGVSVDDNQGDFEKDDDFIDLVKDELVVNGKIKSENDMKIIDSFRNTISEVYNQQLKEREDLRIGKEKMKRLTIGANFIVQFGICPHPVHKSCVDNEDEFVCPIDRSLKNGFLPCLDEIPVTKIFNDTETFELASNYLSSNVVDSISFFFDRFRSFFDCLNPDSTNAFIELIKSISGLIETYEIRVRNLPNSLDSTKTKILSRNLFLSVFYAYRIQKKPKFSIQDLSEDEIDSRLTVFQKFIKLLIENDKIGIDNNCNNVHDEIKQLISSNLLDSFASDGKNLKRKEKELCLFLKRVCLAEYFLLNLNLNDNENELIEWDDVLSTENLSKRYEIEFKSIDLSKYEEFEFKPFVFTKLPKEFLKLSQSPYFLPIQSIGEVSLYNLLDYNHLIKFYNDFDDVEEETQNETCNSNPSKKSTENNNDESCKANNQDKENKNSNENNEQENENDKKVDSNENNNSNDNQDKENENSNKNNEQENKNDKKVDSNENIINNSNDNQDNENENSNENNEQENKNDKKVDSNENINNNSNNNQDNENENSNENNEQENKNDKKVDSNENNNSNNHENEKSSNENDNSNTNDKDNSENNNNEYEQIDPILENEIKKNQRAIQYCDAELLSYLLNFYGKRHYPSVFMFTGTISPQIFLADQASGAALDTFYVDRYECPDVNHLRFQPLFLNEERYEKLIDQILSGDFSYNLHLLDKLRDEDSDE